MSRLITRALLVAALGAPLASQPAEARLMHLKVIRCNVDGTYTCGGLCYGKWCCEMAW
jgi:hypothetical protein